MVFHASQIEGMPPYEPPVLNPIETNKKAERILRESGADIRHGGSQPFYNIRDDYIQVPERDRFDSQADYYATALHELGHWTGHFSRLNRETSSDMHSETYAKEELVAEITSMFVSAETGIPQTQEHFDNHAAYVSHWIKAVKEDPNALFRAVNQAQKASEEILKYERVREREQVQTQTSSEGQTSEQKPMLTEQTIRDMKLIEGDTKVYLKPRVDGQQYKGKILHVDESQGYCVQQVGRQSLVVHKLERMCEVPPLGEAVKISYGTGDEKAKISIQEDRHHGLRR